MGAGHSHEPTKVSLHLQFAGVEPRLPGFSPCFTSSAVVEVTPQVKLLTAGHYGDATSCCSITQGPAC